MKATSKIRILFRSLIDTYPLVDSMPEYLIGANFGQSGFLDMTDAPRFHRLDEMAPVSMGYGTLRRNCYSARVTAVLSALLHPWICFARMQPWISISLTAARMRNPRRYFLTSSPWRAPCAAGQPDLPGKIAVAASRRLLKVQAQLRRKISPAMARSGICRSSIDCT